MSMPSLSSMERVQNISIPLGAGALDADGVSESAGQSCQRLLILIRWTEGRTNVKH